MAMRSPTGDRHGTMGRRSSVERPSLLSHATWGFRHPDADGDRPHDAELAWPRVTDFRERVV
jgi:hypothetical protein